MASPSPSPSPSQSPSTSSSSPSSPQLQSQTQPGQPPESDSQSLVVSTAKSILLAIPVQNQKRPQAVQWTPEETAILIQAYQEKWYSLKRGQLKAHQWEEVTVTVAAICGYEEPTKTSTQCRHKMEKLRKRYRAEKRKGGGGAWPFFDLMDRMECGPQPILARPVNMVRFPNPHPSSLVENDDESEEEEEEEEELDYSLKSRSRSINNLLKKPTVVSRFSASSGYPTKPAFTIDSEEEYVDEDGSEMEEENCRVGEKRLLFGLADEMRAFAQKIAGVEKKKMETMKAVKKMRMEVESKRLKMILDSQTKMMQTIDKWSNGGPPKNI